MNYNAVISVHDISDDSGAIIEPVTLTELKNYMRTEGFQDPSTVVAATPISIPLVQAATTAQDNRLIGAVITLLAREGIVYTQALSAGNLTFSFNATTGTITFLNPGNIGGETLAINYGFSNGGVFNFSGDDTLMNDLITSARQLFEQMAGISIVPHTWEVVLHYTNQCRKIELPYGPNITIWNVKDASGNLITTYTLTGNFWKYFESTCLWGDYTLTYQAGYMFLPKPIKIDIMRLATYMYENRGEDAKVQNFASQLAMKYSRNLIS